MPEVILKIFYIIQNEESITKKFLAEYRKIKSAYFISRNDLFIFDRDWDWWNDLSSKDQIAFFINLELIKEYSRESLLADLRDCYFEKSIKEFYELFCKKEIPKLELMNEEILRQIVNLEEIDWRGDNMNLSPLYHLKKLTKIEYHEIASEEVEQFKKNRPNCRVINTNSYEGYST